MGVSKENEGVRRGGAQESQRKKNVKRLVNVNTIGSATVSAGWQLLELRSYPPTETGLLDDYISKEWLSGP